MAKTIEEDTFSKSILGLLSGTPLGELNIIPEKNRLTEFFYENNEAWKKTAEEITNNLDNMGINYVLMKVFLVPNVHLDDVDLLIENKDDALKTLSMLRQAGYSLYTDRYSLNRLKVTAISSASGIQVDVYPEATWFNMRYAPKSFITAQRIRRSAWGISAYLPNPTLDLYIVITHSYNHGFVSLAEVAYVVFLLTKYEIDWSMLKELSNSYKLNHALILYLKIARLCMKNDASKKEVDNLIKKILEKDLLSRIYSEWFEKTPAKSFPVKIPYKLRILSAVIRIFRPSLKFYTKVYDELLGYGLALLYRGDRREVLKDSKP